MINQFKVSIFSLTVFISHTVGHAQVNKALKADLHHIVVHDTLAPKV